MSVLRMGPDGAMLLYALILSVIVALVSWRRPGMARAAAAILVAAVALAIIQYFTLEPADHLRQLVRASFIIVPGVLLLGASRVNWLARHAWLFILLGPIAFGGCYVAICELCYGAS